MYYLKQWPCLFVFFLLAGTSLPAQEWRVVQTADGLRVEDNGQAVYFYQRTAKPRADNFARAHYLHPVFSPAGDTLTEDFPADHPHHHGIFWAWHQIRLDGRKVADGWDIDRISWEVRSARHQERADKLLLSTEVNWIVTDSSFRGPLVRERTLITAYPLQDGRRRLDFDIRLRALQPGVSIGGSEDVKGYSGFSVRMALPENVAFTDEHGPIAARNEAVVAGPWMEISNADDATQPAITIVQYADNPTGIAPWILRAKASMQNVAFPGRGTIDIPHRSDLRLRYTLYLSDGAAAAGGRHLLAPPPPAKRN